MLRRFWRMWRAKARLLAPMDGLTENEFVAHGFCFEEFSRWSQSDRPNVPPYDALAEVWHAVAYKTQPDYTQFLQTIAWCRKTEIRSILELACGTGILTKRLTELTPDVVGLDSSERMLLRAKDYCSSKPTIHFTRSDFRDFNIGRPFDIVVCASNSLNYLEHVAELASVFRCIARHLHQGGLFAFDTVTTVGMRTLNGAHYHGDFCGRRLVIRFQYDPLQKKEKSTVYMAEGNEIHRRIPIDPADVIKAAALSGLEVVDYFSSALTPGRRYVGMHCFFVLSKSG
ncbi:MAG: methyltransferase domain-containing protein [Planctomycetes bacterium]|nr:methyltransferase domain-containing protein [Planctomycetota bacterium]